MKRLYLLVITLFYCVIIIGAPKSGKCGKNLRWFYDPDSCIMTIKGSGNMNVYSKSSKIPWKSYIKDIRTIRLPIGLTTIGNFAFCGCKNIATVSIPPTVVVIGRHAFSNCTNLKSIHIPYGVKIIEDNAFSSCPNLATVDIPNSVRRIGWNAFACCSSLPSVIVIPSSVTEYMGEVFMGCSSLDTVYYPKGLESYKYAKIFDIGREPYGHAKAVSYNPQNPPLQPSLEPPILSLVEGSLLFMDPTNNNRIDPEEQSALHIKINNKGRGTAQRCEARVQLSGTTDGISVQNCRIPSIAPNQTTELTFPIQSSVDTKDGKVTFTIEIYEPNGWGVAPFDITVATKAYEPPYIQVVDYNIASASGKIRKMEPFTLTFNLQNTKYGDAENVKVKVNLPSNIFVMDGSAEMSYPLIKSGEVKPIQITLVANNNYTTTNIPISIDVKEKHGKFAENKQLDIALNQTTSSSITIAAKDEPKQEHKEIQLAMIKSDVDRNIPTTKIKNDKAFVLIVANEHYSQEESVPFALNDGNIFKEYCVKTLGVGEKHIKFLTDATGNQIKAGVNWLANLTEVFDDPQIIVYYAGHGIPDEASRSAYILPVDGSGMDVSTGYKLDELYSTLGKMPASKITVFMDACFSGSKREDGMLASARGVALKAKSGVPQGNMVVFSAAQGNETAYPNREQQHGLFTYYLLKKLQETEGDVALKDLGDYVTKQVSQQSLLLNSKKQTPCVTPSATVGTEWQSWKLK